MTQLANSHIVRRPLQALLAALPLVWGLAAEARVAVEPVTGTGSGSVTETTGTGPASLFRDLPPTVAETENRVSGRLAATPVVARAPVRPRARDPYLPAAQWDERPEAALWTRTMMSALEGHGHEVEETVPRDIATWCPGYADNPPELRRAFWVGLMSTVAYYESRFIPDVVGGGGRYHGLLQIYSPTANSVDCRADSGAELQSGEANLSCAVRIMAVVVPKDDAIAVHDGAWRGIANQWGPMTHGWARDEMAAWTRSQDYCQIEPLLSAPRPPARPFGLMARAASPDDGLRAPS